MEIKAHGINERKRPQAASERPAHTDLKFSNVRNVSGIPFDSWIAFYKNFYLEFRKVSLVKALKKTKKMSWSPGWSCGTRRTMFKNMTVKTFYVEIIDFLSL